MAKKAVVIGEDVVIKAEPVLTGKVIVIGTDKTVFLKTGQEFEVSAEHAKALIKAGAILK